MGKTVVLVLSAVLSTTAFAQENTVSGGAASQTAIATPAEATSTAQVAAPASERTIKGEAYTKTVMENLSTGDKSSSNEAYIGINKKLENGNKIGVRQVFTLAIPETGDQNDVKMGNTYVYLSSPNIVKFNDNLSLSTTNRLYAPTGESMRFNTKQVGSVRNYLNLVQKLGKVELSANLLSQWYANTRDTDMAGKANNEFYIVPYAEAGYSLTDALTVTTGFALENFYKRQGPSAHVLDAYVGVGWQALSELSVSLTAETDTATINNPNGSPQIGRASESMAILELALTI